MLLKREGLIFILGSRVVVGRNLDWEIELEGLVRVEVLESWR